MGYSSAEVYDDGRHLVAEWKMATRNRRQEETAAKEAEETVVSMRELLQWMEERRRADDERREEERHRHEEEQRRLMQLVTEMVERRGEDESRHREGLEQLIATIGKGFGSGSLGERSDSAAAGLGKEPSLAKFSEADTDIEHYLTGFERIATAYKWPKGTWTLRLTPMLTGKAMAAYANMDHAQAGDYDQVKAAILRRYDINEETYRQRFRTTRKEREESYGELAIRLRDLFCKWAQPNKSTVEEVTELMVMEQLVANMPLELQVWVRERKPKTVKETGEIADDYVLARKGTVQEKRCHKCGQKGHLAGSCPTAGNSAGGVDRRRDGSGSTTAQKGSGFPRMKAEPRCYQCGQLGHIAPKCPNRGRRQSGYYGRKLTSRESLPAKVQWGKIGEPTCEGEVEGTLVQMVVDTGCSCTLVREDLVSFDKVDTTKMMRVQCAHGDEVEYPTAEVRIRIGERELLVKAGVSSTLPRPVLLGRDVTNRLGFDVDKTQAYAVLTRNQWKKQAEEERFQQAKEKASGATPNPIMDIAEGQSSEEERQEMTGLEILDEDLFGKPGKERKTRREKRGDKQTWQATYREQNPLQSEGVGGSESEVVEELPESAVAGAVEDRHGLDFSREELKRLQAKDTTLEQVRWYVSGKVKPPVGVSFFERDGLLYRQWDAKETDGDGVRAVEQLVLPVVCRKTVLKLAHTVPLAGHLGQRKTLRRVLQRFYWPRVCHDVVEYCRACGRCQRTSGKRKRDRAQLVNLPIIEEPFKRIAMDIVGPLERTHAGNRYILVVCDYATRYPEAMALKSIDAESVAVKLVELMSRVGIPEEILTDQGSNFMSQLLAETYRMLGVHPIRTSPYHPQTDGLVERFNGTLKKMLKRCAGEDPRDWDALLPYLLFAYREVPQESTGFSPFELLYGRAVRGPLDVLRETWEASAKSPESVVSHVITIRERLQAMSEVARENLGAAQKKQKTWYDKQARERGFSVGEQVLVLLPSSTNRLQAEWQGPYAIQKQVGLVDYEINMSNKRKKLRVFHVNMLRRWHTATGTSYLAVQSDEMDEDDIVNFPVEEIGGGDDGVGAVEVSDALDPSQQKGLEEVILEYAEVFRDKPGKTSLVEHRIRTDNAVPVRQRPYRLPHSQQKILQEELQKMLDMGVIKPSNSEWASPIVLVPKKDGSARLCVDYRKLNRLSAFDAYPMPRVDDIIDRLGGARFISTFDLTRGYWQVPVAECDQEKTAFTTPYGLYQFTTMPFGLHGAPATFQRLMDRLLRGTEQFATAYLDDLVVYSRTWEEHLRHLKEILWRLQDAGLTAKPKKCRLAMSETPYLGYIVGGGLVKLEEAKVLAVKNFPRPTSKKEVRAFLGLAGYYRKFVPDFAAVAAPLSDLTRKRNTVFTWNSESEKAFNSLKEALCSSPVLHSPDFN